MSRHKMFMFGTVVILLMLTQLIVLRWKPEAVFFVTWLFLALTVKHDSRFSAVVGLVLLAACSFLLLAKETAAAEHAADDAYFFLAIGVIVQLQDLLLERYGWLARKADFSPFWLSAVQPFRRRWNTAIEATREALGRGDQYKLLRLVQVLGTAGVAIILLWSVISDVQFIVILLLLGGAILFPFVVWLVGVALRAMGPAWLLRVMLALVVLPLIAMEMAWLYEFIRADDLARMKVAYDFPDHLPEAERSSPPAVGEEEDVRMWEIEDILRRVLYQHPAFSGASRIAYTIPIKRGEVLVFNVATAPESWLLPGDGVSFAVYVKSDNGAHQVFSTYIDPKNIEADRKWHKFSVDLDPYAGNAITLILETGTGPRGDYRYDWAGWGDLQLLTP